MSEDNNKNCTCKICSEAKKNVKVCLEIYNLYHWLLDSYVLDFFTNDYWSQLPASWKTIIPDYSPSEIASFLDEKELRVKIPLPLSLQCLRKLFHSVNIARYGNCLTESPVNHFILRQCDVIKDENGFRDYSQYDIFTNKRLTNTLFKHVSPKKIHEILVMSKICADSAADSNCHTILDFGSGLGHLARTLAYGYNMKVFCLEAKESLTVRAEKLDIEFEKIYMKHMGKEKFDKLVRPTHINMKIEKTTNINEIIQGIKYTLSTENNITFGIVGLHPCGDLGAVMLRLFKENKNIKFINLVGCCYMKLTTENNIFCGYPLSSTVKSTSSTLSYNSREMSCHAIEVYIHRLKTEDANKLQIHAFRAALEKIIVKYWPEKKHSGLRSVKKTPDLEFPDYCRLAATGLDIEISKDEIYSPEIMDCLSNWKKVVVFYSLRLMFAPMLETILLLDRFLYVVEPDTKCSVLPMFDPIISPRCHILTAIRST